MASFGCSIFGTSFSSTRTLYGPRYTIAFMETSIARAPPAADVATRAVELPTASPDVRCTRQGRPASGDRQRELALWSGGRRAPSRLQALDRPVVPGVQAHGQQAVEADGLTVPGAGPHLDR